VVLAATFPGEPESRLRALIRRHIEQAVTQEWPMMARGTANLEVYATLAGRGAPVDPRSNPQQRGPEECPA
jgi:hypothetical protein